ncbi:MAG: lysylphosphatidylglycerol synthase domain-containing protein [Streptosporangiaceae bacterium]
MSLSAVHWELLPALAGLAVLHYFFAALGLRAAAGVRLPLGRTMLTQFTAAAASRLTPGGLGGTAVNLRFLTLRGVTLPCAITAVAATHGVARLAELGVLLGVIAMTGDAQALDAFTAPARNLFGSAADLRVATGLTAAVLLVAALVILVARRARPGLLQAGKAGVSALARRPHDLAVLLASSLAVALVLGFAFGLSVLAVPGAAEPDHLGALFGAYIVGSAAGSAIPVPGGVGTAEAAFIAALIAVGIAAAPAFQAVLLFRAITFWAPVPIGVLAVRLTTSSAAVVSGRP